MHTHTSIAAAGRALDATLAAHARTNTHAHTHTNTHTLAHMRPLLLQDERWMLRFFAAARLRMPQFSGTQLATLLHGLAMLRVRPDRAWMEWVLSEVRLCV